MYSIEWMPWVDLIDYYINLQRGIQTSILFLAGGREDTVGLQKSKRTIKKTIKKHETTDKRKFEKFNFDTLTNIA